MLPDRVKKLISEYSKPLTNPNWRNRSWICVGDMYKEIIGDKNVTLKYDKHYALYKAFLLNVQNEYGWHNIYLYYLKSNIYHTSVEHDIPLKVLKKLLSCK